MEEFGSHWTDFNAICYLNIFRKSKKKIQISWKSDKNNDYFTCRPTYIYKIISVNSRENDKCLRQKLYDMIHLSTAIGLTPGGSNTKHIYTQTIHRTTQITTNLEECGRCPVFASFTLACLTTEEKARKNLSQGRKTSVRVCRETQNTYFVSNFFSKSRLLWAKVHKYGRVRQTTDWNIIRRIRYCMLDNWGYKHILWICNTYYFSIATLITRTHLSVTFVRTLPVVFNEVLWKCSEGSPNTSSSLFPVPPISGKWLLYMKIFAI